MTECSACKSGMAELFETRDYNHRVTAESFRYARCTDCGLISMVNVPADLGQYYPRDYHQIPENDAAVEAGVRHERYKMEILGRFTAGGRLLEIGPSWGAFCLLAKRAGFEVEAIEMDAECCEFLSSRLGIRTIRGTDETASVADASVPDAVAAWHVLEHLRQPWRLLDRLAQRLAAGGVMVLALPNPEAFQFRLFGRYWTHIDAPRHLHLVPPPVLRKRAEAAGLEQVFLTTSDEGGIGWNRFGWRGSLSNLADREVPRGLLRLAGGPVATLFAPIDDREGRGSAYTAVFRKPARSQ